MHARNRFGATLLSCAIALATGTAAAQEPTAFAGDCFVAGFGSGDADAVAACYAEDAVMWFPGGPMAKGRAAIRDGFAHFFADVTITDVQKKIDGRWLYIVDHPSDDPPPPPAK
jgi:ketosteroid isomerase-like protein